MVSTALSQCTPTHTLLHGIYCSITMLTNTHSTTWYLLLYHNAHQHTLYYMVSTALSQCSPTHTLLHGIYCSITMHTNTHSAIQLFLCDWPAVLFIVSALSAANDVLYTQTHNISCTHNYEQSYLKHVIVILQRSQTVLTTFNMHLSGEGKQWACISHTDALTQCKQENMLTLCSEHSRIHLAELNYVGNLAGLQLIKQRSSIWIGCGKIYSAVSD